jgi:CubicO group peptidase (beta-lactamase class C family)
MNLPHALRTPFAGWTRRLRVSLLLPLLPLLPLTALALSGCAATGGSDAPDAPNATVHDTLQAQAQRQRVCAVAIAVVRHGRLASTDAASGCSPATAVTPDSVFQAASLGKPVFAYAVLKLARQGRIDLDAPVMTYLPQGYRHRFRPLQAEPADIVTDPRLAAVTVRMLLNHTSGLPNWASGPLTFEADPGAGWHYSGEGYLLLQRAVEAVTGQSLDAFMTAQVFGPLAMHDSAFARNGEMARTLVPGTKANGARRSTMDLAAPVAAFTLHTTATDYGRFLAALLGDEALL